MKRNVTLLYTIGRSAIGKIDTWHRFKLFCCSDWDVSPLADLIQAVETSIHVVTAVISLCQLVCRNCEANEAGRFWRWALDDASKKCFDAYSLSQIAMLPLLCRKCCNLQNRPNNSADKASALISEIETSKNCYNEWSNVSTRYFQSRTPRTWPACLAKSYLSHCLHEISSQLNRVCICTQHLLKIDCRGDCGSAASWWRELEYHPSMEDSRVSEWVGEWVSANICCQIWRVFRPDTNKCLCWAVLFCHTPREGAITCSSHILITTCQPVSQWVHRFCARPVIAKHRNEKCLWRVFLSGRVHTHLQECVTSFADMWRKSNFSMAHNAFWSHKDQQILTISRSEFWNENVCPAMASAISGFSCMQNGEKQIENRTSLSNNFIYL